MSGSDSLPAYGAPDAPPSYITPRNATRTFDYTKGPIKYTVSIPHQVADGPLQYQQADKVQGSLKVTNMAGTKIAEVKAELVCRLELLAPGDLWDEDYQNGEHEDEDLVPTHEKVFTQEESVWKPTSSRGSAVPASLEFSITVPSQIKDIDTKGTIRPLPSSMKTGVIKRLQMDVIYELKVTYVGKSFAGMVKKNHSLIIPLRMTYHSRPPAPVLPLPSADTKVLCADSLGTTDWTHLSYDAPLFQMEGSVKVTLSLLSTRIFYAREPIPILITLEGASAALRHFVESGNGSTAQNLITVSLSRTVLFDLIADRLAKHIELSKPAELTFVRGDHHSGMLVWRGLVVPELPADWSPDLQVWGFKVKDYVNLSVNALSRTVDRSPGTVNQKTQTWPIKLVTDPFSA